MIKIKNYNGKAEIYIYGVIVDDTDGSWIKQFDDGTIGYQFPTKIKEQLDELNGLPIDVHIASDGGDVAAGIAIFNMLKNHNAPVTVYIDSWAASIASLIAFAGNKIVMPENTFLMIHNPKCGAFGDADYLMAVADWLDKIKNMLIDTYIANINENLVPDRDNMAELMDKETWLTAKEAAEVFKNVEVVEANDIKAVAQYKTGFDSAPKALKNKDDEELKNKILNVLQEAFSK